MLEDNTEQLAADLRRRFPSQPIASLLQRAQELEPSISDRELELLEKALQEDRRLCKINICGKVTRKVLSLRQRDQLMVALAKRGVTRASVTPL